MNRDERIDYLKALIVESPEDPFPFYALCLENESENPVQNSEGWLKVLEKFPEYLPSYYQAGMHFLELAQKENAIEIWKNGIQLAQKQGDNHALAELKSAVQNAILDDD